MTSHIFWNFLSPCHPFCKIGLWSNVTFWQMPLPSKWEIVHFPQILALCESSNAYIILGVDDLDPDLWLEANSSSSKVFSVKSAIWSLNCSNKIKKFPSWFCLLSIKIFLWYFSSSSPSSFCWHNFSIWTSLLLFSIQNKKPWYGSIWISLMEPERVFKKIWNDQISQVHKSQWLSPILWNIA